MRRTAATIVAGGLLLALLALPRDADRPPSSPAPPRDGPESPSAASRSEGARPAAAPAGDATKAVGASPADGEAAEAAGASPSAGASLLRATVLSVADGDTVTVRLPDGSAERVRLIGVDSPELSHPDLRIREEPYGHEAAAYTRAALAGRQVHLELDVQERDRYGRLLAYVWLAPPALPGEATEEEVRTAMFNARLLLAGYAQVMTVPPDVRYADLFVRLQAEAREAGRGLWGTGAAGAAGRPDAQGEKPPGGAGRAAGPAGQAARGAGCDPSYPDACIPPPPPDMDCRDVPYRRFRVLPPDPHHFDGDGDGLGCEGRGRTRP